MANWDTVDVGGKDVRAMVAKPDEDGPHAGIVICHHGPGLDEFTEDFIGKLAANGYVSAALDYFHRRPEDEERRQKIANFVDSEIIGDIRAVIEYLGKLDNVDGARLGIIGHCLGGRNSFLGGASCPQFNAVAIFYGGNIMLPWGHDGAAPFDRAKDFSCPVIGFFGNDDTNPSPADVDKISAELTKHGKQHEFHRYDATGHAFQNFTAPERYREESSNDAWAKLLDYLAERLAA